MVAFSSAPSFNSSRCTPGPAVPCTPDTLPDELRAWPQWVVWRNEPNGDKKPRKLLYDPKTGRQARTADDEDKAYQEKASETWGTYAQAVAAYQTGRWSGIGFVFTADDPFCGGDIDDCRDPQSGELSDVARRALLIADTYSEVSQSGKGIKFIGRAQKSGERSKNDALNVEMYDKERYFALTGSRLPDTPSTIEARQMEFTGLYMWWFPEKEAPKFPPAETLEVSSTPSNLSDRDLIAAISKSKQGAKFDALWRGDTSLHDDNDSGADLALCSILMFWTGNDTARVESLFRQSGLMREKWERQDYRDRTLTVARHTQTLRARRPDPGAPVFLPALPDAPIISVEEWEAHGKRLHKWKEERDEQFRYAAGKWYAYAQIPHGHKEAFTKQVFGLAYLRNIQKWASAVNAWGDDWEDGVPMWVHQELQAQEPARRLEIVTEFRQGGMNREALRALIHYAPLVKTATDWQAARKVYEKPLAQDLVDVGESIGYGKVQHAVRQLLGELLAKHRSAEAPKFPPAETLDIEAEADLQTRVMVEAAVNRLETEAADRAEQDDIAQRWQELGIIDESDTELLPISEIPDSAETSEHYTSVDTIHSESSGAGAALIMYDVFPDGPEIMNTFLPEVASPPLTITAADTFEACPLLPDLAAPVQYAEALRPFVAMLEQSRTPHFPQGRLLLAPTVEIANLSMWVKTLFSKYERAAYDTLDRTAALDDLRQANRAFIGWQAEQHGV